MSTRPSWNMALVGGGGGFIGAVHATAACLDRRARLTAGALSSRPEKAIRAAAEFGIPDSGSYGSWQELLEGEAAKPSDERAHFVTVATPNATHHPIAKAALEAGFPVVCDKPLAISEAEAEELVAIVRKTGLPFLLTHNYSGYPLVRQARDLVASGELGEIRAIRVQYVQGGLLGVKPGSSPARGAWKADPALNGPLGTMADVGTHAYQLARFVAALEPRRISCQLRAFSEGRLLDDYGTASIELENGALATLLCSQVTHGRLNDLSLEIDGSLASLTWRQEDPNELVLRRFGEPRRTYERHPGAESTSPAARAACRIPPGHPEGYLEAFANLYGDFFDELEGKSAGLHPTAEDGLEGLRFLDACRRSHALDGGWTEMVR